MQHFTKLQRFKHGTTCSRQNSLWLGLQSRKTKYAIETVNKESGSNKCKSDEEQNGTDKFIQLSKKQLNDLIENMIDKPTKPMNKKIFELENLIKEITKSQTFISEKYDDLTAD